MEDGTRELDQIQDDLEILHERSQSNKLKIATHEAACEERYMQEFYICLNKLNYNMMKCIKKFND